MEHPVRPDRVGRTRDWRDCQHCAHYTTAGNSGGTPPWAVCQFWPRRDPATCESYAYTHKPWLNEAGEHWSFALAPAPPATPTAPTGQEGSVMSSGQGPRISPDHPDAECA